MKTKKALFMTISLFFLLALLSAPVHAGWVEKDRQAGTMYISGALIKVVPQRSNGMWSVMDLNSGLITMINRPGRTYAVIDPKTFCSEMKSMMTGMMQGMPPEQRAMMEQMMGGQGAGHTPSVRVRRVGSGGKVAGHDTIKYSVTVDGRPYRDIWLAPGAPIMNDMRRYLKKSSEMNASMAACSNMGPGMAGGGPAPEASKEYQAIAEKGWTMKELDRKTGKVDKEVTSLEKKSLPASTFRVPIGYRKVNMREMMMGRGPR